jgi:DNA segregation ATPase FtsK/SpoIIIE-like protein
MTIDPLSLAVLGALLVVNGYMAYAIHQIALVVSGCWKWTAAASSIEDDDEPLLEPTTEAVRAAGKCSTSLLQRKFRIGYGRAARLVDLLAEEGVIEWRGKPSPGLWVVSEAQRSE